MKKIIIIALLFVLSINQSIIYANTKNNANGKYIIINNESTNPYELQNSGTIKNKSKDKSNVQQKSIKPYGIDKVMHVDQDNSKLYHQKTKEIIPKGSKRNFTTVNFRNNNDETITADLKYSGTKVDVWVHEDEISDAQAIFVGKEFENNIYPLITENFGEESDVDGNSKINILIYDIKDNFESTNAYTQGYFYSRDLYDMDGSNKGEVLYIDGRQTMEFTDANGNTGLEALYPVIVHEFQHMVNYNENKIKENGEPLDTWIDEGLSLAAETIYTKKTRMDRIEYYNISYSIQNGHSLLYWDYDGDVLSNYALSYLFMEYLNIQCDEGDSIFKEIIQSKNNNYMAIEEVVKKHIDYNTNFGQFMTDFRLALALNQSSGKYGFKGKEGFDKIQKSIYSGSNIDLRGGGAVVVESSGLLNIPSDKGEDIVYVGSNDIQKNEINHIKIIGDNRYDTASKISKKTFESENDAVVLINGKNSSDGLSAGPFASLINGSMLLVEKESIPKETIHEIKRLNPKKVYLIGGKSAIGEGVLDTLNEDIGISDGNIIRIGGKNREETSLLIANEIKKLSNIENIYVVNGYKGEADAMSILSKACNEKSPILITNGNKLNKNQIDFIKSIDYPNFYFIGGYATVNNSLLNEVENLFDIELSIMRVYGDSRQNTNAEILDYFYNDNINSLIVCKSDNLIDALCVGVFAGKNNIPVLIATNNLSSRQEDILTYKTYDSLFEVGGGISSQVINKLK
ncbi:MAG: cell wall-binding repeat-containing protein [Bacilli bacterium]|nr:cell wall-binding repeat-containing protein [Bacilli bacterium]